ncbi:hypothetical protein OCU04_012482 [Sclerotinia nivalis]|uniref:Uncharacterized protein n=1 Tax=Sclerotinia nivalis TaxID=352851 RepID=A0A9X0ACF0_9HELO|nr:hypothetical protein OCU04_012482 [Sclerotinia nivalis]
MADPQTPRENSRPFFSQEGGSSTSSPKTSTTYITTTPKSSSPSSTRSCSPSPSPSSSSSYDSSTIPPSTLTTKMRSLWSTSHTKLLTNLHVNLNPLNFSSATNLSSATSLPNIANLPNLKPLNLTTTNSPHSFTYTPYPNYTPIPNLSSPNGLPDRQYENQVHQERNSNPLSGPSTRRAEYLFSRVDGGFLEPDTPPLMGSCGFDGVGESGCMGESSQLEYKTRGRDCENIYEAFERDERYGNENGKNEISTKEGKKGREKRALTPWKIIRKSCKEVLDGINTHLNGNLNTSMMKCANGGKVTGQENGNRSPLYVGLDIEEQRGDGGNRYDYDAYTEGRYGCGDYGKGGVNEWNEGIRTRSRESIVEVLFDVEDSSLPSSHSSISLDPYSRIPRQEQNSNQLSEALERQTKLPKKISHPVQVDSLGSDIDSLYEDERTKRTKQERIEKKFEGTVNEWIDPQQHANFNMQQEKEKEKGRQVLVGDFAYMEMRPVFSKDKSGGEIERVGERGSYRGSGGDNGYIYGEGYDYGNKWGSDSGYAKSSLDLEDSMYDSDEGDEMGFGCESSRSDGVGSLDTDTDINASMDIRRNSCIFNPDSNSSFSLPPKINSSPRPHPNPHQSHQSHPQHPHTPSSPPTSTSLALIHFPRTHFPNPSFANINIDLDLSTSQLSLPSTMLDSMYLFGSEMPEFLMDLDDVENVEKDVDIEKEEKEEKEEESKMQLQLQLQLQLSPYTFPGTNLYLYEPKMSMSMRRGSGRESGREWRDYEEGDAGVFGKLGKLDGGNEESRGVMMHFSREPTGLEGLGLGIGGCG